MAIVRYRVDPANPPRLSEEAKARYDVMTDEEAHRNALADPDNQPLTEAELAHLATVQWIRRVRAATGLSQAKFAARYHINPARLRDWEQGRFLPDSAALAYLRVIEHEGEAVERALRKAG